MRIRKTALMTLCIVLLCASAAKSATDASPKSYTNSIGMEFVSISAGSFIMGEAPSSPKSIRRNTPFKVTISNPFYMGKYEVTQEQWRAIMGNNPAKFQNPQNPIEWISWNDIQLFIRKLNRKEGTDKYRLPTEAEWEYAARAGSSAQYFFGNSEEALEQYAWYWDQLDEKTQPVGRKKPNPWGLHDMYGNVWEWVGDWYGDYPDAAVTDPQGPSSGSSRVARGGSWRNEAKDCRSSSRNRNAPDRRRDTLGFRLILALE